MTGTAGALLTDLYPLTMLQAYAAGGMNASASFELFVRTLPPTRNVLVAAGLEQALEFLETLRFRDDELSWLAEQPGFSRAWIDTLRGFRFEGDVDAVPEGTVVFANEPLLRVTAPLPQAQLVESRLLNLVHLQTLIASKAARLVFAARGRRLVDFGLRRAHGAEAALLTARAAYVAGFDGTATAEAGRRFGIPVFGTMAHAFIQAHASEAEAFVAYARAWPQRPTLVVDTYDTEVAVARLVALAPQLAREGITIGGVRLDSGDLAAHARAVRVLLDCGGLPGVSIIASGNLDERRVAALVAAGAPIDAFGIGTALTMASDSPALDAVYKLQAYAGWPRRKRSEGKAAWPGARQVCRFRDADGTPRRDRLQLADEACTGEPLLQPVMRCGRRLSPAPTLAAVRAHAATQLATLPPALRALDPAADPYPVEVSDALRHLAQEVDAATG